MNSTAVDPQLRIASPMSPKRIRTMAQITRAARELAATKGYDEFTLDELAECAGVSRRTLFNYFDGKLEATLGGGPQLAQSDVDTFLSGGPSGEFIDDVAALALGMLRASAEHPMDRDDWHLARACFEKNPKLIFASHQQFEGFARALVELFAQRTGIPTEDPRHGLVVGVIVVAFQVAMRQFSEGVEGELGDLFLDNLGTIRQVFA
jgi:AcrR family transcriptional regulator